MSAWTSLYLLDIDFVAIAPEISVVSMLKLCVLPVFKLGVALELMLSCSTLMVFIDMQLFLLGIGIDAS
jgi:hypothetical protein